jgi:hypothetical protein
MNLLARHAPAAAAGCKADDLSIALQMAFQLERVEYQIK